MPMYVKTLKPFLLIVVGKNAFAKQNLKFNAHLVCAPKLVVFSGMAIRR